MIRYAHHRAETPDHSPVLRYRHALGDQKMINEYDIFEFDTRQQHFKPWLERRIKRGKRDKIDKLAKRIIDDKRLPVRGSLGMFRAHLASKRYSAEDLQTFEAAWLEYRNETFSNRDNRDK